MTRSNRLVTLILLLASGAPLAAQSQDTSLERSMVQLSGPTISYRTESFRGLLFNDKGMVLTTWRNVSAPGNLSGGVAGLSTNAKLIGVHPTRDLALLQVDVSRFNPQWGPRPAKLATAPVNAGDQIYLYLGTQPTPGLVSSETEPVGNSEYYWITGRDPKASAPWPDGWGSSQPRPDNWVTNLRGEVQGVVARVVVNGKIVLRVIPVHDVKPEDFVPPAQKRPNAQKAEELIRMADSLQRDRDKGRYRPVPFGSYEPDVMDYLRLALAEDPTNKDVNFRLGVIRDDSKANPSTPEARGSLPDPTKGKSSDQVDAEFIRSRVNMAIEHLKAGRTKLGEDILKDVVTTYPNNPEAKPARELLEKLQPPK